MREIFDAEIFDTKWEFISAKPKNWPQNLLFIRKERLKFEKYLIFKQFANEIM